MSKKINIKLRGSGAEETSSDPGETYEQPVGSNRRLIRFIDTQPKRTEGCGDEEHRVLKHRQVERHTPHLKAGVHTEKSSTR